MYAKFVPPLSCLRKLKNRVGIYRDKCSLFKQLMFEFGHIGIISSLGIVGELFTFYPVQYLTQISGVIDFGNV